MHKAGPPVKAAAAALPKLGKLKNSRSKRVAAANQDIVAIRLEHLARTIHALGPRVLFELFAEHLAKGGDLVERLERYAAIDPDALEVTGGDHFAPRIFETKRENDDA